MGMKVLAWYIDPNVIETKNTLKCPYPVGCKNYDILITNTQMISNTKPTWVRMAYIFGWPVYEGSIDNLLVWEHHSYTNWSY
jgi:hypothetical protein